MVNKANQNRSTSPPSSLFAHNQNHHFLSTSSSSSTPATIGTQLQATQSFDEQISGRTNLQRTQLRQHKDQTTDPAKKATRESEVTLGVANKENQT